MISESLHSSALIQFPVYDDCLIIGSIPLIRLVQHAGPVVTGSGRYIVPEIEIYVIRILESKNSIIGIDSRALLKIQRL